VRQKRLVVMIVVGLLLLSAFSPMAWAQVQTAGMKVEQIKIEGNKYVATDEIRKALDFKVGDLVTTEEIEAGGQRILDLGYFQQVTPDYRDMDEGIEVIYEVEENPLVKEIEIEGNKQYEQYFKLFGIRFPLPLTWRLVKTDRILEILKDHGIEEGKVLNMKGLKEGLEAILAEYQKNGYVLVRIGDVKLGEKLKIELIESQIERIELAGIDERLEAIARELISLPLNKPVRIQALQESFRRINNSIYFERTDIPDLSFSQGSAPDKVILSWQLRPRQLLDGPAVIERVQFMGNTIYSSEELAKQLGDLPQGEMDNFQLLQALQGVYDLYHQNGYTMMDLRSGGLEGGTLTVEISEGVIEEIIIKGNSRTKEYVIRKELKLHPGDVFNEDKLRASYLSLQKLGYFQDIGVDFEATGPGRLNLILTVKEKEKLGSFGGTLSYTKEGLVGKISLSWKNLFGTGQDISLGYDRGLLGKEQTNWHLDYSTTTFFPRYDFFKASLFQRFEQGKEDEQAYMISRAGGEASLGYPFGPDTQLTLSNRYERFQKCFVEGECEPPGTTHSITIGLTSDDRNSADFPTAGGIRRVTLEQAGAFAAGTRFTKLSFTVIEHLSAFKDQDLALRLYGGLGFSLPSQEEFSLGGVETLRGLSPFRTERFVLLNAEYRFKLLEEFVGLFFLDLGRGETGGLQCSLGLEGRVAVPYLGILRFVFSWPVTEEREAWWAPRFQFGFGQMF